MTIRVFDELYPTGPRFPVDGVHKLGTDSLELAEFVKVSGSMLCADLGCGSGALILLLAAKAPGIRIHGIEINTESADLALAALEENELTENCSIIKGDLRNAKRLLPPGRFDLVVSNPPYFERGAGKASAGDGRALARDERCCQLDELCIAASALCKNGGVFALVHRPERLVGVFSAMTQAGIEPKRLRFVAHRPGVPPSLVLIEGKRGGRPSLKVEPLRILYPDIMTTDTGLERRP